MAKKFRPYIPEQSLLLPPSLSYWVPEGHLARFISEVVDELDLSAIEDTYDEERGYPPYDPRMMTNLLRKEAKAEGKDPKKAEPSKRSQCNFTDPESRIQKTSDGFIQGSSN